MARNKNGLSGPAAVWFIHGSGLGVHCWATEAAFALLHWVRRLRIP